MLDREELEALGAIFGDSVRIDKMMIQQPIGLATSSNTIRGEIERLAKNVPQSPPSTPVQYQKPVENPYNPPVPTNYSEPITTTVPQNDNQLELSFDMSEQQKTNELLKEISLKLTKLTNALESKIYECKIITE